MWSSHLFHTSCLSSPPTACFNPYVMKFSAQESQTKPLLSKDDPTPPAFPPTPRLTCALYSDKPWGLRPNAAASEKKKKEVGKRCSDTTAVAVNLAPEQLKSSQEKRCRPGLQLPWFMIKTLNRHGLRSPAPPLSELCCKHTTHLHHLCKVQFSCFYRRLCLRVECWGFPESMWPVRPQRHKWRPLCYL